MSEYIPDRWVMLEFVKDGEPYAKKVFGGWYGGYGGSDSWKLSSGVVGIEDRDDYWEVTNHSGSIYKCYKKRNGMSSYQASVLNGWVKDMKTKAPESKIMILTTV
jgi:hypothetical protein